MTSDLTIIQKFRLVPMIIEIYGYDSDQNKPLPVCRRRGRGSLTRRANIASHRQTTSACLGPPAVMKNAVISRYHVLSLLCSPIRAWPGKTWTWMLGRKKRPLSWRHFDCTALPWFGSDPKVAGGAWKNLLMAERRGTKVGCQL
ncbi:hypothetical protein LB507_011641 [Fusarium sp. FIESC RH6]|nr:hypothetical protein LB507_011641 [Fusarium sp. FIESC RH6]